MSDPVTPHDDRQPFDETAATRTRRRCFFCDAEKSDEWKFLTRLNAFICRACVDVLEGKREAGSKAG